jgi:hypothetical protein
VTVILWEDWILACSSLIGALSTQDSSITGIAEKNTGTFLDLAIISVGGSRISHL